MSTEEDYINESVKSCMLKVSKFKFFANGLTFVVKVSTKMFVI